MTTLCLELKTFFYEPSRQAANKEIMPHISFSPTDNLLAWTDIEGTLTRWPNPIPSSYPHPAKQLSRAASSKIAQAQLARTDLDKMFADVDIDEDLGEDDQDAIDKMAVDNETAGVYDDDWVIDDDGEPGAAAAYKTDLNGPLEHDGHGTREMGK